MSRASEVLKGTVEVVVAELSGEVPARDIEVEVDFEVGGEYGSVTLYPDVEVDLAELDLADVTAHVEVKPVLNALVDTGVPVEELLAAIAEHLGIPLGESTSPTFPDEQGWRRSLVKIAQDPTLGGTNLDVAAIWAVDAILGAGTHSVVTEAWYARASKAVAVLDLLYDFFNRED